MTPLKIVSHRNNAPADGWAGIGLAALCLVLAINSPKASSEEIWSTIFTVMFLVIGCWTLIWSPKRITIINRGRKSILLEDSTRFKTNTRFIPFAEIAEVLVRKWEDPDPDIRPFKRILYCVAIRLHSAEEIEVTDLNRDQQGAAKLRLTILNYLSRTL